MSSQAIFVNKVDFKPFTDQKPGTYVTIASSFTPQPLFLGLSNPKPNPTVGPLDYLC